MNQREVSKPMLHFNQIKTVKKDLKSSCMSVGYLYSVMDCYFTVNANETQDYKCTFQKYDVYLTG